MPGGATQWKPKHSPWLIAVAVMIATFMEVMDTSIASVAVPYIAGSTASTTNQAEWVLTVYLVANAVFLPASNWFSLRFGRKRFLMFSIMVFTVASFLCGIAPTLGFILLARAIQGAGGGALQPLSQAILIESFPPEKQGQALGLYALGVVLAPVIGPAFGGYLTDAVSWRWAFYINIPVGILALVLQSKFLEDPPEYQNAKPGKFDGVGLGLLGLWIGCLQFILDKGQELDWFGDTLVTVAAVVTVLGFVAFLVREFTHEKPLVNLRALTNRNLAIGCALVFALGGVLYGLTTVLPIFYQTLLGYSATASGFAVSPRGLGSIASSVAVGILVSKMDPRLIVAAGFAVLGGSGLWLSFLTLDISPTTLFWPTTISGLGLAMIFVPLSKVALGTLGKGETGNASGIFNFLRNIGGSVGISAANTIAQRHLQAHRNDNVHWYTGASWMLRRQLNTLTELMQKHAGPGRSTLRALSITNSTLNSQAQLWAYVDVLRYFALTCAICIPFAFLLKRPKAGAKGEA
ncbi:DHA2 family efflux MFS transporter permease subunit [Acidicapsa ligni]|uniref:DHA2 family efflux MFS transporter permease subunit n=1 Tax=Acidicapsa ligni TaxID=542300 RepID=UPI0021DFAE46|nr:DHA2 family efflux MFS transporter permease subunit [Acidicapsa ligni]